MKGKFQSLHNKQVVAITLPVLFATFFLASAKPRVSQAPQPGRAIVTSPKVIIKNEPGTPLRLTLVSKESATTETPEVQVAVTNLNTQPVTAYAIRYETISVRSTSGGLDLTNTFWFKPALQPGESGSITVGEGGVYSDPIKEIIVSVDFVEFTDGITWGKDIYRSGERLAGQRAGARAAATYLIKLLRTDGSSGLMDAIDNSNIHIDAGVGNSPEWQDGFRTGVGLLQGRLQHMPGRGEITEIESELRRAFNFSERK